VCYNAAMSPQAQITCEFTFEASHELRRDDWSGEQNLSVFGSCARLHGHSYRLLVTLLGPIDPDTGMVKNFRDLKRTVRQQVIDPLDHQHLNDVVPGLSTAENLCYWIARQLLPELGGALYRVELWETRTAYAALTQSELSELQCGASIPPGSTHSASQPDN
jgi:6-pyruvoyltetrahydropterin/6-carboxytetrahydropterin synthase